MRFPFKKIAFLVTMLLGYGVSSSAAPEKACNKSENFVTKEELETLGLPSDTVFVNESGDVRFLKAGEIVKVETHEENNSISFSTFDNYSISVPDKEVQAPRNVSGEAGL